MTCECKKELYAIYKLLKVLSDKVLSRTNAHAIIIHDTSTSKTYDVQQVFGGSVKKANDLTILSLGGGFTVVKNGENSEYPIPATLDLTFEDEDIFSLTLAGSGVGTAYLRLGAYLEK